MTPSLEQAVAEAAKLSPEQQDDFARWMLAELADERRWQESFDRSADLLAQFADEALEEYRKSQAT